MYGHHAGQQLQGIAAQQSRIRLQAATRCVRLIQLLMLRNIGKRFADCFIVCCLWSVASTTRSVWPVSIHAPSSSTFPCKACITLALLPNLRHLVYACCRLPAAYRLALAECARPAAWKEMFAGQAALKACLWLTMLPDRQLLCIFSMRAAGFLLLTA
jgi:hypothetical protein